MNSHKLEKLIVEDILLVFSYANLKFSYSLRCFLFLSFKAVMIVNYVSNNYL